MNSGRVNGHRDPGRQSTEQYQRKREEDDLVEEGQGGISGCAPLSTLDHHPKKSTRRHGALYIQTAHFVCTADIVTYKGNRTIQLYEC